MIRVLLVEDHETVRHGLRLLLDEQPDMTVVAEASNGRAAIDCAAGVKPDVVVLDLTMPGMSGLSTAKALRAQGADAAIIALTRHDDDAYVQELTAAGAAGYVLKRSSSHELLRAIRAVAAGGRYFDPALPAPDTPRDRRRATTSPASPRELEVLRLTALGHTNKEIAAQLKIAIKTVEVHKANAMRKLSLRRRSDVVRYAVMKEWLRET